ncbi:MAG: TetR/AcrR family transcriptional regulator [Novosphingobium sp.]
MDNIGVVGKADVEAREVVRTKGRPSLAQADEINRALREAAMQVLLVHGEGATINAVAKAAGLTRKSLYARYPSKNDLFVDVIREALSEVGPVKIAPGNDFKEQLENYIDSALAVIAKPESRAVQRIIMLNPVYVSALRDDLLVASRAMFFEPLLAILEHANKRGEIVIDDPHSTAQVLIKLIFAESAMPDDRADEWYGQPSKGNQAELIARIVLYGLLPRD